MIEFDTKIKALVQQQTVIKLVEVPAKKYGYLAIHLNLHIDPDKLLSRDFKLPGIYAITHIPTGAKLPFNGTLANLRLFCKQCGDDSELWDNPDKVSDLIVKYAESFKLIRYIPIN